MGGGWIQSGTAVSFLSLREAALIKTGHKQKYIHTQTYTYTDTHTQSHDSHTSTLLSLNLSHNQTSL